MKGRKLIGEIGALATTVIGLRVAGEPAPVPPILPSVIDPIEHEAACAKLGKALADCWLDLPPKENEGWTYRLDVEPFPVDAVATADAMAELSKATSLFPYSACRSASLTVKRGEDKVWGTASLKLADPRKVQTVRLPTSGKVDMHTSCGINVTNNKTESTSAWAILGELVNQAKAVRDAYKQNEQ